MSRNSISVILWIFFLIASYAGAAEVGSQAVTMDAVTPTAEEITTLKQQAEKTSDIDKPVLDQIENLYDQSLEQLAFAEQWSDKAKEFKASQAEAPELLRQLNAELKKPVPPVHVRITADSGLAELEPQLLQAESTLEAANRALQDLRLEKARRAERRIELPNLLTTAREQLEKLSTAARAVITTPLDQAQDVLNRARRYALANEINAYEQELLTYEVRGDLLERRLEHAQRRIEAYEQTVEELSRGIDQQRSRLADAAVREAEREVEQVHVALRDLAEQNLQLTMLRGELSDAIEAVKQRAAESDARDKELREEFDKIKSRVAAAGLTNAIGQFLRKIHANLPKERRLRRSIRELRDEVGDVQARIIDLEDQRGALRDSESIIENRLAGLEASTTESERAMVRRLARELLTDQKNYLDELISDYGVYFSELVDLDVSQRKLLAETQLFARYIEENILWTRSANLISPKDVLTAGQALEWLVNSKGWAETSRSIVGTVKANPVKSTVFTLLIVLILGIYLRLRQYLHKIVARSADITTASLARALTALAITFALAATIPAVLWFVAWLLATPYETSEFAKSIAVGLRSTAILYFTIEFLRQLILDGGVGARIFKWRKGIRHPLIETLTWLQWVIIPTAFVAGVMDFQSHEAFRNSLGRIAFVVPMIALAVVAYRIVRPKGSLMTRLTTAENHKWIYKLRYAIYGFAIGLPATLAIASLIGYYYTAYYLSWRITETLWLLLVLLLFNAISQYWLNLRIRQRAMEQATESTAQTATEIENVTSDGLLVPVEEEELDAETISTQTSSMLHAIVIVGAIAGSWLIWSGILPAFSVLDEIELWSSSVEFAETTTRPDGTTAISKYTQQVPITLTDLGYSLLLLVLAFVAARNLPGLMEIILLERLPLVPSVRYAITSLSKYTIAGIGIVMAFNAIGIGWSNVQWLVAAMTVGLAFGLQEIFANLVSGIIILFERPIRIGDVVTVGNVSGTVSRIRIRATTITDWDRKELIVPNKHFITQQILNWTLSDAIIRVIFPVSVSRGTEVDHVKSILLSIARDHPLVLQEPEPTIVFKGFGPGALQFDLRVFIRREDYAKVLDAVNTAIEEGLKKADIEIAVDRQEIQVRPSRDTRNKSELPHLDEQEEN